MATDRLASALAVVLVLGASACRRASDEGEAPPPVATARPGVCDGGGGTARFDGELLPRRIGDYCLDPYGETRAYGVGVPGSLEDVCVELFNGECEVYMRYGLDRVTTLRYVDGTLVEGRGSAGSVSVTLSRFSRSFGAYGFFTKRVLSDRDPLDVTVKPLDAGAAAALGAGIAYVWRGRHVLELTYVNEEQAPEQLRASAAEALPRLAQAIGDRLPGSKEHLPEVALLPDEGLIPLGVRYESEGLLGVAGTGPGALGHYRKGEGRYRVLLAVRDDEASARDLLHTLSHGGKGWPTPFKQRQAMRARFAEEEEQRARVWVFARRGRIVVGVGDDVFSSPVPAVQGPERASGSARESGQSPPDADLEEGDKFRLLADLAARAERQGPQLTVALER